MCGTLWDQALGGDWKGAEGTLFFLKKPSFQKFSYETILGLKKICKNDREFMYILHSAALINYIAKE